MSAPENGVTALTAALAGAPAPDAAAADSLRAALVAHGTPARPVIRAVHHLACSGGTLIARAIAAQARVYLLSEVDPFTTLMQQGNFQPPTDVIQAARNGGRALDPAVTEAMFLAALTALCQGTAARGSTAVLRVHSHSQFHTKADPDSRPGLQRLLAAQFTAHQVVTLRHPLDCWLALVANDWLHFDPPTLDHYCARSLDFVAATAALPRVFYEDFVTDPETVMPRLLAALDIDATPGWQGRMGLAALTGDSGRKGATIAPRPRRPVPAETAAAAAASPAYDALCARLGYDPDPAAAARPA